MAPRTELVQVQSAYVEGRREPVLVEVTCAEQYQIIVCCRSCKTSAIGSAETAPSKT